MAIIFGAKARLVLLLSFLLPFTVSQSVVADSVYIDVEVAKGPVKTTDVGLIHAVDSWFITIATLGC